MENCPEYCVGQTHYIKCSEVSLDRRLTGQQHRNGVRALINPENVNSVWERGTALPFPWCITKTAPSPSHPLPSAHGPDAEHHRVALPSNRWCPVTSAGLWLQSLVCSRPPFLVFLQTAQNLGVTTKERILSDEGWRIWPSWQ